MALQLPDSMPWRIYQAYLQGPSALLRLFEEAFGRHALYGPPDPDQQQRTIDALSEDITRLKAQNERLQAEVSDLRGHNFQLQRRNAELEALVAKDSHNSSALLRPTRHGRSGRGASDGRRVSDPAARLDIVGRRCGSVSAPTASSNTGRKSAEAATRPWPQPTWCATADSKSWRSSRHD